VIRLTGSRSKIVFRPLPTDDPTQRCPDITLARQKLGWQPVVELEEGLQRTIDYFKGFAADELPGGKPRGTGC
jgi:UDP-glucuronate decarboxylase